MDSAIRAEIIAIGTEILLGEITDTNSVFIAKILRDLGINLYFMTTVGDNERRIEQAIAIALERADVVITCGGLGPTVDDMTRQGVALATGRPLVFQQDLLDQIGARFSSFRVNMTENNKRQAYLPEGATVIENPVGTAPSFLVEHNGKIVISLPGVPREMKFLMQEWVVPHLRTRYTLGVIVSRILKTAGIGESMLDELLGADLLEGNNPTVGLAAHHGIIDIRITAKAESREHAEQMIEVTELLIRERADRFIFGDGDQRIEQVLGDCLSNTAKTISLLEAGIDTPVSTLLKGYTKEHTHYEHPDLLRKTYQEHSQLNLRELAEELASQVVMQSNSDYGVVILSLPEVTENSDVEYGTAVAISGQGKVHSRVYGFGAKSDLAKEWVSTWIMAYLWRLVKESM